MNKTRAVTFWLIVVSAAILHGAMYMGRFALPHTFDPNVIVQTAPALLHALLEHYGWIPSFLAGMVAGRRGALVGVLTVVLGAATRPFFQDLWLSNVTGDDWDSEIVNLAQALLAVACSVVAGIAGESVSRRIFLDNPLPPIARDTGRI